MVENFLIARRLIEAGARVVTLNFSRWDWHGGNFRQGRHDMPMLDRAVTALVDDLHQRGLDRDVSVVVWGEFGRTPKINKDAGRDHWPQVSCALLACGGMKTGQVIGSTNRLGEYTKDRPVSFAEVLATVYHNMGLMKNQERIFDLRGRRRRTATRADLGRVHCEHLVARFFTWPIAFVPPSVIECVRCQSAADCITS
jgi:hypothetical protein